MESSLGRDDSSSHETPFISNESELLERAGLSHPLSDFLACDSPSLPHTTTSIMPTTHQDVA